MGTTTAVVYYHGIKYLGRTESNFLAASGSPGLTTDRSRCDFAFRLSLVSESHKSYQVRTVVTDILEVLK